MTKVLITGDQGFIGRNVCDYLSGRDFEIIRLSEQVEDILKLDKITKNAGLPHAENVIHLAGKIGVQESWEKPSDFYAINVGGTQKILDYCHKVGANLIYISAFAYDSAARGPFVEESRIDPSSPYNHSKWLGEELCRFYMEKFKLRCTILRPFNVYGAGQRSDFLIPEIIRQVESDSDAIQLGDLSPVRDYLYIEDLMMLIARVVTSQTQGMVFNAGTGKGHSVKEVVRIVQSIWRTDKLVQHSKNGRKFEVSRAIADITKAEKMLGWRPQYSLADGLLSIYASR